MKYCRSYTSAVRLKRPYYKTGKPCSRGHNSHRFTKTRRCVECDKVNALGRRTHESLQTPKWANLNKIKEIYRESKQLGIDYHVDHIIPLRGKLVSGLHVHDNLQIIPRIPNLKKTNSFEIG